MNYVLIKHPLYARHHARRCVSYERKSGRSCPQEAYKTIEGYETHSKMQAQMNNCKGSKKFTFTCKREFGKTVEEVALEHWNIGRIWRCITEGASKKSFPEKEIIQEAQRRESMTGSGRKTRVSVWLEQGLLETWRNKVGLRVSQVLCAWEKVWPGTSSRDLPCAPRSQHSRWGPRPFAPARQSFPSSCPFPEAFFPSYPGDRSHRCALTLAFSSSSWKTLPSPETHHSWVRTAQRGLNVAEQSPSSPFPGRRAAPQAARQAGKASSWCWAAQTESEGLKTTNPRMHGESVGPWPRGPLGNVVRQTFESAGGRVFRGPAFLKRFFSPRAQSSWNMLVFLETVVNDIIACGLQRRNLRPSLDSNST